MIDIKIKAMKLIYLKYLLLFAWMTLGLNFTYAQELCEQEDNTEEQCDSCGEEADDADASADIGEEGGEMNVGEADMMGTDAAEEAGTEVGSEVGTEIGAEVGAEAGAELGVDIGTEPLASAALDAIPGVGELVMAVMFLATIFESIEHTEELKAEEELAHKLSGGNFTFPIFPSFATHAEDLNGSRNTVSYLFFYQKEHRCNRGSQLFDKHGYRSKRTYWSNL